MECEHDVDKPMRIVLLANRPRMFREMLYCAIAKTPGAQLVLETENPGKIPSILARVQADWLIVTLTPQSTLPRSVEAAVEQYPSLSVLGLSEDNRYVKVLRSSHSCGVRERRRFSLKDISLPELLGILNNDQEH